MLDLIPVPQLVFFVGWLALALAGGALLVFAWERWRSKAGPR